MLTTSSHSKNIAFLALYRTGNHRRQASSPIDRIVKHKFDLQEAARKFVEEDKKRLFAKTSYELTPGLTPIEKEEPLKKWYLPFFVGEAEIGETKYTAEYGVERIKYYKDSKGRSHAIVKIDWYPTSGSLKPYIFSLNDSQMQVYAGFQHSDSRAEEAVSGHDLSRELHVLDPNDLDSDATVDPFLKRIAIARQVALDRIRCYVKGKIRSDSCKKHGTVHVGSINFELDVQKFKFFSALIPFYALKYPHHPARLMPAITNDTRVVGPGSLSRIKVTAASVLVTAATTLLWPLMSVPLRLAIVASSGSLGALYAAFCDRIADSFEQRRLNNQKEENEKIAETKNDRLRREATTKIWKEQILHGVDSEYYQLLGLDPSKPLTQEELKRAFYERIREAHPDITGKDGDAVEIIKARDVLSEKFKSNPFKDGQRRGYCTRIVKVPGASLYDPSARKLIDAVLIEKNYKKAQYLVDEEGVHPDAHDKGENTLLSESAKQGNVEAIRFAIDILGASPDASCDCPHHNTALHYGAKKGNHAVVRVLLEKGALPNIINSLGETPLDVAISTGNQETIKLLKDSGGIENAPLMSISRKIFGYGSNERTMLAGQKPDGLINRS